MTGRARTSPIDSCPGPPWTFYFFLRRTSSSGAAQGYGLMSISAGSSTRGPTPLGQMYSQIGPKRTRSWTSCWIWNRSAFALLAIGHERLFLVQGVDVGVAAVGVRARGRDLLGHP